MLKISLFLVLSLTLPVAFGQEARATVSGRVVDAQGAVIPAAEVVIRSADTGVEQITRTNPQGNWSVRFLTPETYAFSVTAAGFKQVEHQGILLQTANQKQIDTQLEVGSTSSQVEVTAEAPLIDTTAATSGVVITRKQIEEMPSMSRIATLLATLSPGVVQQDQNQNVAHLWSHDAASQISADGGETKAATGATTSNGSTVYRSNDYQLDGMPNIKTGGQVAFPARARCHPGIPTRWSDVRASRVNNLDAIISKTFVVRERVRIQYRFEVYNVANHVRFGTTNADPTSSSFGKVDPTEQNDARVVQMALKLFF